MIDCVSSCVSSPGFYCKSRNQNMFYIIRSLCFTFLSDFHRKVAEYQMGLRKGRMSTKIFRSSAVGWEDFCCHQSSAFYSQIYEFTSFTSLNVMFLYVIKLSWSFMVNIPPWSRLISSVQCTVSICWDGDFIVRKLF